ncbi:hypothetical protein ACK330_02280 [Aeromonas taiwanensis]|uniref:hypothetical protein n=1 Tax=Aeromonas taiwanensis TaxID=633417 RepID=UPI003988BF8C
MAKTPCFSFGYLNGTPENGSRVGDITNGMKKMARDHWGSPSSNGPGIEGHQHMQTK